MKILVIGGTRFFGIHMVNELLEKGHDVTIATRGKASDGYGDREIIAYVEQKTGTKAVLDKEGENAPYNREPEYSINTEKANAMGFRFSVLQDWIYELLDYYIQMVC